MKPFLWMASDDAAAGIGGREPRAARPTVLLVEDEPTIAITLSDDLTEVGVEVTSEVDGLRAMRLLSNRRFDAVITDLRLPGADGIDVVRHTRRTCPATKILLVSAYLARYRDVIEREGVETLHKPFANDRVLEWLRGVGVC